MQSIHKAVPCGHGDQAAGVFRVAPRLPAIGAGATMLLITDRKPVTVIDHDDDEVQVQEDKVVCVPGGIPRFESNPVGRRYWFTWDARLGCWRETKGKRGAVMRSGAQLMCDCRQYYRDPAFPGQQVAAA